MEFAYTENVHVDIALTTYPPQVDKRGHLANHLPTPFCPRGFWMTPYYKLPILPNILCCNVRSIKSVNIQIFPGFVKTDKFINVIHKTSVEFFLLQFTTRI